MKEKRQLKVSTFSTLLLLLGILVLINLIAINIFKRVDLTEGKIFTLAKASKDVVANLPDRLTVKAYFTKDLDAPYSSIARYLRDQLDEYKARSNGNFRYEFVDPGSEEELEKEARGFQIPSFPIQVIESDKIEIRQVYMGLVFLYQGKHETIPVVQSTANLEYDLTSTIKKITAEKIPNIGFLTGHGEANPFENMTMVMGSLEKNYIISSVEVAEGTMVPDTLDALLIVGPTEEFDDWSLFAIDQYIMKGGKVGWLINKINANLQESRAVKANLNLDDFTRNLGFKINDDLVIDRNCGMVSIQENRGFFTVRTQLQYPFFPMLKNFSNDNLMVRDLEDLGFFFPSSLDTSIAHENNIDIEVLVSSSDKSNRQSGRFVINPTGPGFKQLTFPQADIPLAAAIIGSFNSYFQGDDLPWVDEEEPYDGEFIEQSPETRMVVVGDGHFPLDIYMNTRSNATFFLNIVDWLAQDESLIHIRTREVTARPLADISEGLKRVVKFANIFLPALLVILIGIIRWQIHRSKKVEI